MEWDDVVRLHHFFLSHGHWVIFVFRFLPVGRTIISLPAGMACMSRVKFALWTAAGSTVWNCILTGAGYYLGSNFQMLDRYVGPAALAVDRRDHPLLRLARRHLAQKSPAVCGEQLSIRSSVG